MAKLHRGRDHLLAKIKHMAKERRRRDFVQDRRGALLMAAGAIAVLALFLLHPGFSRGPLGGLWLLRGKINELLFYPLGIFLEWVTNLPGGILIYYVGGFVLRGSIAIVTIFLFLLCGLVIYGLPLLALWISWEGITLPSVPNDQESILRSGWEGEREALGLLRRLGNDCHIYTNLRIPDPGSRNGSCETDLLVVNPGGITIIEVKNHVGSIRGDRAESKWIHYRHGDEGQDTRLEMNSPLLQVNYHGRVLGSWLARNGLDYPVRVCVFFAHKGTRLYLTDHQELGPDVGSVFSRDQWKALLAYAKQPPKSIPGSTMDQVLEALNGLQKQTFAK